MRLGHRVSPPWFGFALATTAVFCGLISVSTARSAPQTTAGLRQPLLVHDARMPTWKCVFHLRARYVSQWWLTPTAPGARRSFGRR
jgi:hypothetical protein